MAIQPTEQEIKKAQKRLNELYKIISQYGISDFISEIVELEILIEKECNK